MPKEWTRVPAATHMVPRASRGQVALLRIVAAAGTSGRTLTGMLAVFADFERDILKERVHAGIADPTLWFIM